MARCVDPLEISLDEYRVIFGDSDEEGTKDIEEMVLTLIFWVLMRMVRKVMKKRTVKVATKKPLTATMKKNNNGQLTSVSSLLTNFQLNLELLSSQAQS